MIFTKIPSRFLTFICCFLILAGCRRTSTQPPVLPTNSSATLTQTPATASVAASRRPTPTLLSVSDITTLVKAFAAAWDARDPQKLLSFYSHDLRSYDATGNGQFFDYLTIQGVLNSEFANGAFSVKFNSFFISDDARFAVMIGTFTQSIGGGKPVTRPYVSLLEFQQGLIIRVLDYYGGASSKGLPLQTIPATANQPASSSQAITDVKSMLGKWETAYNTRDIQTYLSFYADKAQYTQVVSPDRRVLAKNKLSQEMTSNFTNKAFKSALSSAVVSVDGHFAAVQGLYTNDKTSNTPMIIILEIEGGKIIQQYDYLLY